MTSVLASLKDRSQPQHKPILGAATKVNSHWKLLKTLIRTDEEDNKTVKKIEDSRVQVISHGVHHVGKINTRNISEKSLKFVAYNFESNSYCTINDDGKITVYFSNGKSKQIKSNEQFKGIIFATKTKQWVCWGDGDKLKLISESFKPISTSQSVAEVNCAVYNKSTHEVITVGHGNITCWSFRYGGKYLMTRKVITEHLENCIISHICLEDCASKTQRCFVSIGSSVASFDLLGSKCLTFHTNRHAREITSLIFFNPLKYLVTAAKDGSIKVWNDDGGLETTFVGHHGSVNALAVYPFGHFIMSASNDMTMRVWSLEGKDEVDKLHCNYPIDGVGTMVLNDHLYSFSTQGIDMWKIKHIHTACTMIGCKVKTVKQTTHPKIPLRILCICADATVRIVSPQTGDVLTTSLVPDLTTICDAVYSAPDGLLFTLLINGKIMKSTTFTNPCTLQEVWEVRGGRRTCTCLCLYEYIVEDMMAGDSWKKLVQSTTNQQETNSHYVPGRNDRTLLLGGCVDGRIVVFNWQDKKNPGKVSFEIEAHRDEIVSMISNPKIDQFVSSGLDNIIKVWRLFPFAEEALAPLMTLYFDELPRHLCVSHHRLLVALYDRSRANYSITVYKTTRKERYDHTPEHDHSDEVIAVASCPKMRLFASASLDGSVRIWDESSRLRQIIKLNTTPSSLCFCSDRGDLIVAIGDSLHKIKYSTYMPKAYVFRMVAMEFKDVEKDPGISLDEKLFNQLSLVDKQRVTKARSLVSKLTYVPEFSAEDESTETKEQVKRRAVALEKIHERETDLKKLRDGEIHSSKKKPERNEKLREEAFEKYISLIHKRTVFNIPDDFSGRNEESAYQEKDVFVQDRLPAGFFSIDPKAERKTEMLDEESDSEDKTTSKEPEDTDVITRERSKSLPYKSEPKKDLYPDNTKLALEDSNIELSCEKSLTLDVLKNKPERKQKKMTPKCVNRLRKGVIIGKTPGHYPFPTKPLLDVSRETTELAMIEDEDGERFEAIVIAPDGFIPNSVVVALFADMRPKEPQKCEPIKEEITPWRPPQLTEKQLQEISNKKNELLSPTVSEEIIDATVNKDFEDKLRSILRDTPTPEELEVDSSESVIIEPEKEPELSPLPNINNLDTTVTRSLFKPLEKRKSMVQTEQFMSKSPPPMVEVAPSLVESLPPTPTPPPPVVDERPLTPILPLPHFIVQFKGISWFDKIFPNANPRTFPKPWTVDAFVELLLIFLSKVTDYDVKHHITAAIMILCGQEGIDSSCLKNVLNTVISELNIPYGSTSSWNSDHKKFVLTALKLLCTLKHYTAAVISEIMMHFILGDKEIRSLTVEIFNEIDVENAERYFLPELDDFDTWGIPHSSVKTSVHNLCNTWLDKWLSLFKEHIRSLAGKINRANSGHVIRGTKSSKTPSPVKGILKNKELKSKSKHGVSWNFNTMGDKAAANASYIDAINYFSEMQLQTEIENERARRHSVKKEVNTDEKIRNTVLILPNIETKSSLARLGETHCSHCHPERETALTVGFVLPPINQNKSSFIHNIALRLNTLTLNPFPEESDIKIYEAYKHHELLTLRSSQKYFFPSQSYVQPQY